MPAICLNFQLHQPYRIRQYDFTSIGTHHEYFDEVMNRGILDHMCDNCYLPANELMLSVIEKNHGEFRISFSISGSLLEQLEANRPDVLESFLELHQTGCVEWIAETYYHSLASQYSRSEFVRQVEMHRNQIEEIFGIRPQMFRNTELLFSNDLVNEVVRMGFAGILVPSTEKLLKQRSPNYIYKTPLSNKLLCLPKNSSLTAEISRHFYTRAHEKYPLTPLKFTGLLDGLGKEADCVSLFMDYGVFSKQQEAEHDLLDFFEAFPKLAVAHGHPFYTPSELLKQGIPNGKYDVPYPITWSYPDYNLGYLTQNDIQQEAINRLYELEEAVLAKNNPDLLMDWSRLQASDHFFYMTHKFEEQGGTNIYSPYKTAYDAYNYYLNVLTDLELRVRR
ncbi:MAG: glycoside hydrolase family 57 protein [Bacteroidia bacterium]